MTYKTPAAISGKGLEMLPGYPNAHHTPSQNTGQGYCSTCAAFDPYKNNVPGYGYCKRRGPSVEGDQNWPRVHPNDWCLDYVARNNGGAL